MNTASMATQSHGAGALFSTVLCNRALRAAGLLHQCAAPHRARPGADAGWCMTSPCACAWPRWHGPGGSPGWCRRRCRCCTSRGAAWTGTPAQLLQPTHPLPLPCRRHRSRSLQSPLAWLPPWHTCHALSHMCCVPVGMVPALSENMM